MPPSKRKPNKPNERQEKAPRSNEQQPQQGNNHHYSTRYETKNEISEASRNPLFEVTTYQGSANAMGIP